MTTPETEVAWAAGFFDGEGSSSVHYARPGTPRIRVHVTQKNPQLLVRFQHAVGTGRVTNHGAAWRWVATTAAARTAIETLWPYLGAPKREQYATALARVATEKAKRPPK